MALEKQSVFVKKGTGLQLLAECSTWSSCPQLMSHVLTIPHAAGHGQPISFPTVGPLSCPSAVWSQTCLSCCCPLLLGGLSVTSLQWVESTWTARTRNLVNMARWEHQRYPCINLLLLQGKPCLKVMLWGPVLKRRLVAIPRAKSQAVDTRTSEVRLLATCHRPVTAVSPGPKARREEMRQRSEESERQPTTALDRSKTLRLSLF